MIAFIRQMLPLIPRSLKDQIKEKFSIPDMKWSLQNLKDNGFRPETVIDVGAYEGNWTRLCKTIFPSARVLMIEPQAEKRKTLEQVLKEYENVSFKMALLGESQKEEVTFYKNKSVSSVLPECESEAATPTSLPMNTLDIVTSGTAFGQPDFIKLDVQGYELKILEGGSKTLSSPEVVLMEVSLIEINRGAPLFHEVVQFMANRGFRIYDICSLTRRPYDNALWQVDVIFVRHNSSLISSKRWD